MRKNIAKIAECENGHHILHYGSIFKGSDKGTQVPELCVRCSAPVKSIRIKGAKK